MKTMEIEYNPYKGKIVPKANELIEKRTLFTRNQERIFSVALRELQNADGGEVKIDRKKLCEYLEYTKENSFSKLRKDLSGMKEKSSMKFMDEEAQEYVDISVITKVRISKDVITIRFNEELLNKLKFLSKRYTKYFQDDFCSFRSKMSMKLYERLMELHIYSQRGVIFSTEQLYDIFCLKADAYRDADGNFKRSIFERRTIMIAVDEINEKTKCIKNLQVAKLKEKPVRYKFTYDYVPPEKPARIRSDATEEENIDEVWEDGCF